MYKKTYKDTIDDIVEFVSDIIFPEHCYICKKGKVSICDKCVAELEKYKNKDIENSEVFSLYKYEDEIRKLIIGYKFYDRSYLKDLFVKLITNDQDAFNFISSYDIIIPVPLHKKRKQDRGYNQSELIARKIARILDVELLNNALVKVKNIKPQTEQVGLNKRKENVIGAYKVIEDKKLNISNKKILLIDDVYTTGSTYNECKKTLIEAGAKIVGILTIAKD